jgi:hypothetical protein
MELGQTGLGMRKLSLLFEWQGSLAQFQISLPAAMSGLIQLGATFLESLRGRAAVRFHQL